jgi:hypothetical protein
MKEYDIMKQYWILTIIGLSFLLTGCNYDYENQKKADAVSPDTYIKQVANEFFSPECVDTVSFKNVNRAVSFLKDTYGSYPNAETGQVAMYNLLQHFKALVGGDITVLPAIISGFNGEQGIYEADTQSKTWIKKAAAKDSIVLRFKDQYGQDREALMAWGYSLGQPIRMTFVRKSGMATVDLPDRLTLQLRNLSSQNDSAMTVTGAVGFDQSFTTVTFNNTMTYLDYDLESTFKVSDSEMNISGKLTRGDLFLADYELNGTGTNMLHGFIDKVDYQLALGTYTSRLNIMNKLSTTNKVADIDVLRKYLLETEASSDYDYVKGVCDIVNKEMNFRVWNDTGSLLCSVTMYPVKLNGNYIGAPYINWIYGDSQDMSDFGSSGIKTVVSRLQQVLLYLNQLFGKNTMTTSNS